MTKNKKAIFFTVGTILLLVFLVLIFRNPEKNKSPASDSPIVPVTTIAPAEIPSPVVVEPTPLPKSSLHNNISELIDVSTKTVTDEVPGLVGGLKRTWAWFTAFDTKHAVIIGVFVFFLLSVFIGGKKKS